MESAIHDDVYSGYGLGKWDKPENMDRTVEKR